MHVYLLNTINGCKKWSGAKCFNARTVQSYDEAHVLLECVLLLVRTSKVRPEGLLNFISLLDSPFRKVGWRNSTEGPLLPFFRLLRLWLSAQCMYHMRPLRTCFTRPHYRNTITLRDRENNLVKTTRLSWRSELRGRDFNWLTSFIL